jgi:cytochrome c-type biogenesis protein CcmH/NrfG
LSGDAAITHGLVLYYNHDFTSAETVLRNALQLEPSSAAGWIVLARVFEAQRRFDAALESVGRAAQLVNGGGPALRIQTLCLEAYAGRKDAARQSLIALQQDAEARKVRVASEYLAFAALAVDEPDKAIDYLQEAIDQRGPVVLWLRADPRVDPIRSHPRFGDLLRQLGAREPPRTP